MQTPTAQHIDRTRLYTDLLYRFNYVAQFVGFGEADIRAIKATAPILKPLVQTVVDLVYVKLFSFDITKAVFLQRNEGFEGNLAADLESLKLDNEQIKFRKDFLSKWVLKLVTAEYDEKFIRYLDYVGVIHTKREGARSIAVEYIHCNALFGFVEDILVNAILNAEGLDDATKCITVRAFNKLVWIQNDLFARHYVQDGEDVRPIANGDKTAKVEKMEGCPHQKIATKVYSYTPIISFAVGAIVASIVSTWMNTHSLLR